MNNAIRRGSVFLVNDQDLTLPPNSARTYHGQRTVVVISANKWNMNPDWDFVLVVPTSSSGRRATPLCVKLAAGSGNLTSKCWARVIFPQPMLKTSLGDRLGELPDAALELITLGVLDYAGALDE